MSGPSEEEQPAGDPSPPAGPSPAAREPAPFNPYAPPTAGLARRSGGGLSLAVVVFLTLIASVIAFCTTCFGVGFVLAVSQITRNSLSVVLGGGVLAGILAVLAVIGVARSYWRNRKGRGPGEMQ